MNVHCQGYGIGESKQSAIYAKDVSVTESGISATLVTPRTETPVSSPLIGRHNLENILAAAAVAHVMGIDPEVVQEGIRSLERVPGRLEPVPNTVGVTVLVDYAHTPDALAHAVDTCRELAKNRLVTVFGCGGDRDPGKRPEMVRIAVSGSDLAVVTSDNPRTEEPMTIIRGIMDGIYGINAEKIESEMAKEQREDGYQQKTYIVEPDRKKAIKLAIETARPGDIVLIAGKGHEDYQVLGTQKIHFDDREEANNALKEREKK